jgi:hypothetical protein
MLALEQIYNDLIQNGNGVRNTNRYNKGMGLISERSKRGGDQTHLRIKRRTWSSDDLAYWSSYYIPIKTLEKFDVSPIQYVFLQDIIVWTHHVDNPIYAYKIYNGLKTYKPFAKTKHSKWISSCTRYDVQGFKQLPKTGDLLIITKSLKDVMVLHELGYSAVAPHGENHAIPNDVIYNLQKRFKHIVVLYDWDYAGIRGAKSLEKKHKLNLIFIPQEHAVKDISDYVKKYTLTKGNKLIKDLLHGR